ncbi:MAG TPA: putative toxin-antitoxin system toxin component, PIN family [Burkholderiales bacterium]|nr:putative toxin-antitoxin system toxin component, PIN family [Burkholderiales bacterium]
MAIDTIDHKSPAEAVRLRAVLDTNVLVSLLVYRDARYARIWSAWAAGQVLVVANEAVAAELGRVLARPEFAARCAPEEALAAYRARVQMVEDRPATAGLPRCADADDQKFLELAESADAHVLVTEDKALLRLRRRCRFAIERPAAFLERLPAVVTITSTTS